MTSYVPADSPLHEMGVGSIAQGVSQGDLKPTDLVEALLSRITNLEDRVQAWSYLDAEDARAQAIVLTGEAAAGKLRGPLHGVPVGIKDEFHVQGIPTGMRNLDSPMPESEDATPVARLRAAGAIIMGKAHMRVDGVVPPTRNPWNLDHTAGGTSSGSGAAVGARTIANSCHSSPVLSHCRALPRSLLRWGRASRRGAACVTRNSLKGDSSAVELKHG